MAMKYQVTFETAVRFTKTALNPIPAWPIPMGSSTSANLRHNLFVCVSVLNVFLTIGGDSFNVYENRHDPIRGIKITSELCALCSTVAKIMICRIQAPRLQALIAEMETFVKHATREEREMIQFYVDKCLLPHAVVFISGVVGPLAFICTPMLTSQPLPGDSAYPFSVEPYWLWLFIYISQSLGIVQVGCMLILDVMFAILIWYTGTRFRLLALDFQKATNIHDVHRCARKHQELLRYTDELKAVTRIMAVEVVATTVFAIIVGGFILTRNPTMAEAAKYIFYEIGSAMELFLFSWPADNLIESSEKVGDAAYDCEWIGASPKMLKDLLIVIQRSRKPIIFSVDGILPALSLEFYGSTMAASFSYLTTLRAMTDS